jgi:hypothetical protein
VTTTTSPESPQRARSLIARISQIEWIAAAVAVVVLAILVAVEPDIVEAPFASTRAIVFTFGGTAIAAVALVLMLRANVHPVVRLVVLGVPLVIVSWWLISPYFIDDVVNDEFSTSIAEQQQASEAPAATPTTASPDSGPTSAASTVPTTAAPTGPTLLAAGQFVGLAGHDGTGDAGVFRLENGSQALRFENFNIENGPDLEVYVVPGRDQRNLAPGSVHLGSLRGNIGDQTYDLADPLAPGDWTVLVWCEAFSVEFVAASLTI